MIVLTSPTGSIGGQVVERLADSGEPVRVIVRDPARLPATVRESVEVVRGSHSDIDVVNEAFAGADAVFWLVPPDPRSESVEAAYLDFTRPACDAFRRHGVSRVVGVSALGRGVAENAGHVSASLAMDDLIASTGVHYRALALPSFMDNILRQAEAINRLGQFFGPISADLELPTCATRDVAAAAAELLRDRSWTGVDSVAVLGPEDLSFNGMARIVSEVLGKPVQYTRIPGEAYRARMVENGMSEAMAQGMLDMAVAKNNGIDKAIPRTPESSSPTSFREWLKGVGVPSGAEPDTAGPGTGTCRAVHGQ